ncbi:long-chain fatty acid transporter [Endozoicomonas sp. OPT23]|uniref:OmpP1/FadL family transporter n=1 Tax=Endozoicomonas sp. OPT23 TaxID=2072845 RepID=UPI00129BC19D|nr:outer membrane protein transport protein [Endozoicomonas sp. OPT23]MRI34077.1 long-chain fatty acid transporter [Endozoicomonas sp. OPT23]
MTQNGTTKLFALSAVFAAMIPAMQANAAGFQVGEHSAAGLGRAFAGEAAIADDASVVARNVAGMSFLEGRTFTGAVSYIKPVVEIENNVSGALSPLSPSGKDKAVANEAIVPVFYYVAPVNDKLSYGVGGFTNYGFTTDFSKSTGVTPAADYSEVMSYNLNASLSYKLQDNLSVGFGANAVYVKAQLTNTLGFDIPTMGIKAGTLMDVKGDDWGYGWNVGILWEPVSGTRIGASYRSSVKTTLEGKAKSDIVNGTITPTDYNSKGSVDLELPSIAELSVYQQINENLAVHASYMKTGWSSFEEIVIDLDNGAKVVDKQGYNDASRWAVGATYKYSKAWTLRAGYAYDNSPVGNVDRSFRIPDTDRQWYSFGAKYKLNSQQSIDLGYAFLKADKAKIEDEFEFAGNSLAKFEGEVVSGNAHIFSIQYNQTF